MLHIDYFSESGNSDEVLMKRQLDIAVPGLCVLDVSFSIDELSGKLSRRPSRTDFVIIKACTLNGCQELIGKRDTLLRHPIIFILESTSPEIMKLVTHLRPRLITFPERCLYDISLVLVKNVASRRGRPQQKAGSHSAGQLSVG